MEVTIDDGGRTEAGYKGSTGDCACRAIAIATGKPYQEVYDLIKEYAQKERLTKKHPKRSHPRTGVHMRTMRKIMDGLGWTWVPTKRIGGQGATHLDADELPSGRIIARVSKHFVAVVDGVVHDTYDPTREETRMVYGYWCRSGFRFDEVELRKWMPPASAGPTRRTVCITQRHVDPHSKKTWYGDSIGRIERFAEHSAILADRDLCMGMRSKTYVNYDSIVAVRWAKPDDRTGVHNDR